MMQLLKDTELNGEQLEYAEMSIRAGERLTRLLGDILDLSRIEADRMVSASPASRSGSSGIPWPASPARSPNKPELSPMTASTLPHSWAALATTAPKKRSSSAV